MEDHVRIGQELYKLEPIDYAPMVLTGECNHAKHVIKDGQIFLLTATDGSIPGGCNCGLGLYHRDTRFLSEWDMQISGTRPVLLSLSAEKNYLSMIELSNRQFAGDGGHDVPQETLYLQSARILSDRLHERLRIFNYNGFAVTVVLTLRFDADYADIFEVRGVISERRGRYLVPKFQDQTLVLSYLGDDGLFRQTRIAFLTPPSRLTAPKTVEYRLDIPAKGETFLEYTIEPRVVASEDALPQVQLWEPFPPDDDTHVYINSYRALKKRQEMWLQDCTQLETDDRFFNQLLHRGVMDLGALTSDTRDGPVIAAGIPWYTVPFGRDSLITCLEAMIVNPDLAAGTLRFLARFQGRTCNDWRDEDPGKILHEIRQGQLANLGAIPHTPYYGTVDATPLFVVLLDEYVRWTGDEALLTEMWTPMRLALEWIDKWGDLDGDGYVEYKCRSPRGLVAQGWKDSWNAVIHPDGKLAQGPIALAEVQGYVYMAKRRAADLFRLRGFPHDADRLEQEAAALRTRFNRDFFLEEEGFYAMALDGDKKPVRTITSNPGHCLWSGIIDAQRASEVARWLMAPEMFSGWGVRTMSNEMLPFNPMSYHNGTVWPHDNAIIAKGLAQYGFKQEANRILTSLYESSWHFPYYRLPELFCGFTRAGELDVPVRYPVACSPQAWAAGAVFMLIQAVLGMEANARRTELKITDPMLPAWIHDLHLRRMNVGKSRLGLHFFRTHGVTGCEVTAKEGPVRVVIEV